MITGLLQPPLERIRLTVSLTAVAVGSGLNEGVVRVEGCIVNCTASRLNEGEIAAALSDLFNSADPCATGRQS